MPVERTTRLIPVSDGAGDQVVMALADLGSDGTPLVFVHGLGGAATVEYAGVASHPSLAERRCLLIDLIGSGESGRGSPASFSYSIEDQAACLGQCLDALELEQIVLFGHSMGGSAALSLAALNPGRVAGLILAEANLDPGGGPWSRAIADQPEAQFAAAGFPELLNTAVEDRNPWSHTLPLSSPVALHREAVSLVRGTAPTWRQILYALACPRACLFGSRSLPDPDFDELRRHGIATLAVPEAGHNLAWDNPEALASVIVSCLTWVDAHRPA
ncbi:MAG: alpha/beta hydrolase [Bifidobacteriaceae bacterium]|jgi:pimeloyl-ACP methyl ester carboxylesterase|nr:alpha/beta hydrolase [Bifidobacteriaceae bacterium]